MSPFQGTRTLNKLTHILLILTLTAACCADASESLFQVDPRALISRSDLIYLRPASGPGEGQPIGNGVMATLVWTTPDGVHFLINRTDVMGSDNTSENQFGGSTDEFGSVAWVSVRVGGRPFVPWGGFSQRLSLYDGECLIQGEQVTVRCFVASDRDVLILEVEDRRSSPPPLEASVTTRRPAERVVGKHVTGCAAGGDESGVFVTQVFQEKAYHCAAAVVVRIDDRAAKAPSPTGGELTRTLSAPGRVGKRCVTVSSAASWDAKVDVLAQARQRLTETESRSYEQLRQAHVAWWHNLWSRTFVHATSADGVADYLERVRNYHLYILGCSSRGPLPARSCRVFKTAQGHEQWDGQFWLWNLDHQYYVCYPADAFDLLEPFFAMYSRWLPNCEIAARQRWGVPGAFFPETSPFNGPKVLPEDVAKEFQDVMRGRKPSWELSERAIAECSYDSQLHVTAATRERGKDHYQLGRYTWISHYVTGVLDIGLQYWWRYRCTGDREWLRSRAYPILRGGMEFYRGLAGEKGSDGKYHIYPTNARERFWGVRDSITDLGVLRGAGPIAIRAAEMLDVDADLRGKWREFLDNLVPYPMGSEPECKALTGGVLKDDTWAAGRLGDVKGSRNGEIVWESPVFPYEHVTLATKDVDPALWEVAWRTCQAVPPVTWGSWSRTMLNLARMGDRARVVEAMLGHLAQDRLIASANMMPGNDSSPGIPAAFQDTMLQCLSPRPGEPEVLMVYPCWPDGWNGSFRLLARGGSLVGSTIRDGQVGFIEIESRLGETCRLRNPWPGRGVVIESNDQRQEASGALIEIPTRTGSRHLVHPSGSARPTAMVVTAPPQTAPAVVRRRRLDGQENTACLGKPGISGKLPARSLADEKASPSVPRQGLRLWLRSDRGVKADGGLVEVWEDQSGNGFHARAAGTQRPVLAAAPAGPLRQGRYIRLQHPTDRVMVAEVEVYSGGVNIAQGKRAAQKGQWGDCAAGNAVDGDTFGEMAPKDGRRTSVVCTDVGGWWEVDLGKTFDIDKMVIWNLSDSNAERQVGLRVSVLDENRKAVNEYDIERNRASWAFDAGRASAADDLSGPHSGLPAIRFDGRSQYLQGTNGLGMNLPGPFTLVVVATVKDGWPKAIFSLVPESGAITGRIHDYNSPFAIAFHCATGTAGTGGFGLSQGSIGGVNLSLTVPCAKPGRPESVVIVRPVTDGEAVCAYLDGQLSDLGGVNGTDTPVKQTRGYLIGSRWPLNAGLFGRNDVYEILLYDRVLSEEELQSLHQYLRVPRTP